MLSDAEPVRQARHLGLDAEPELRDTVLRQAGDGTAVQQDAPWVPPERPLSILKKVLLPEPLGPIRHSTVPTGAVG